MDSQDTVSIRKIPTQARARRTVELIVDTAAQILAEHGEDRLTTNFIAERGGFSIGTIYQYFPNREAILHALIERERERAREDVAASLGLVASQSLENAVRQIVRSLVETFRTHRNARSLMMIMVVRMATRRGVPSQLDDIAAMIVATWRETYGREAGELTESEVFVVTRGVLGALRAAIIEDSALLERPEFEDALVRLILGFLAHPVRP